MNDIVESMRYCASVSDGSRCAGCKYGIRVGGDCVEGLLSEAADEIEFLNKVIEVERKEHKEALEAERKKHNWISVKDRLPRKTGMYLVYEQETGAWQALYEEEEESFGYWHEIYSLDGLEVRKWEEAKVTHWMPLPDTPKEEEE